MTPIASRLRRALRALPLHPLAVLLVALVTLALAPAPESPRDIVYTSSPEGRADQIWLMSPDGSERLRLTPTAEGVQERFPTWSPDGTGIAFLSNRHDPGVARPAIFVMNADGSAAWRVGPETLPYQGAPHFSPDGRQIVFAGGTDGTRLKTDLYVMGVHGSDLRRLTNLNGFLSCPRWSPDGEAILFSKDIDQLLVVDVATGRVSSALPAGTEGSCGDWSPDGTRIAFSSGPDRQLPSLTEVLRNPSFPHEIFVYDRTHGELTHRPEAGPHATYPRWSSDGEWLVFQGHIPPGASRHPGFVPLPGASELYTMRADGSDLRRLTNNHQMDGQPSW